MKRIAAIALIVAATLITAGSALAQEHRVKVTVPFSFRVGMSTLPSGTYIIRSGITSADLLSMSNWDKRVQILTHGQPVGSEQGQTNKLVFHKYGDQYFLSDIRCADASMNLHFITTKAEKRARAQTEEAGLQVNDPVMIALN